MSEQPFRAYRCRQKATLDDLADQLERSHPPRLRTEWKQLFDDYPERFLLGSDVNNQRLRTLIPNHMRCGSPIIAQGKRVLDRYDLGELRKVRTTG